MQREDIGYKETFAIISKFITVYSSWSMSLFKIGVSNK